jgi:hypothetical protein
VKREEETHSSDGPQGPVSHCSVCIPLKSHGDGDFRVQGKRMIALDKSEGLSDGRELEVR